MQIIFSVWTVAILKHFSGKHIFFTEVSLYWKALQKLQSKLQLLQVLSRKVFNVCQAICLTKSLLMSQAHIKANSQQDKAREWNTLSSRVMLGHLLPGLNLTSMSIFSSLDSLMKNFFLRGASTPFKHCKVIIKFYAFYVFYAWQQAHKHLSSLCVLCVICMVDLFSAVRDCTLLPWPWLLSGLDHSTDHNSDDQYQS